jgi:hypothetical protein
VHFVVIKLYYFVFYNVIDTIRVKKLSKRFTMENKNKDSLQTVCFGYITHPNLPQGSMPQQSNSPLGGKPEERVQYSLYLTQLNNI